MVTWEVAVNNLCERSITMQEQLNDVNCHPELLIEIMDSALREKILQLCLKSEYCNSPLILYQICLEAICRQALEYLRNTGLNFSKYSTNSTHYLNSIKNRTNTISLALYAKPSRRYRKIIEGLVKL